MYTANQVPYLDRENSKTGCCALINPKEWDEQIFEFKDKLFAKASTRSFMHIPLNMDGVMKQSQAAIDQERAAADEWLILSKEVSPWRAEQYFAVKKPVPGLEMERMTGIFMTKVFEGPFKDAGKWHKELVESVKAKGKSAIQTYFFYTTCPNCAKAYGKNFVVGFAQVG